MVYFIIGACGGSNSGWLHVYQVMRLWARVVHQKGSNITSVGLAQFGNPKSEVLKIRRSKDHTTITECLVG